MAFEKRTWEKNSRLWDRLNNIEDYLAGDGGGSSDFSTATVTVVFDGDYPEDIVAYGSFQIDWGHNSNGYGAEWSESEVFEIILYQGEAPCSMTAFSESNSHWYEVGTDATVSWSGNAVAENEYGAATITGDCVCTITIS